MLTMFQYSCDTILLLQNSHRGWQLNGHLLVEGEASQNMQPFTRLRKVNSAVYNYGVHSPHTFMFRFHNC